MKMGILPKKGTHNGKATAPMLSIVFIFFFHLPFSIKTPELDTPKISILTGQTTLV